MVAASVIIGGHVDVSAAAGDESASSTTSLRNLIGSKIAKGLGGKNKTLVQASSTNIAHQNGITGAAVPDHVGGSSGAAGKVAGGIGFVGSILGEVLVSYSTSTMPPGKRHSISATAAHFEELAAEAGLDLDADEMTMEGLRMYRLEEGDSAYALDDDSDDNNGSGGKNDNNDANATNQKLAHKERSIFQMVDVLSDRLTSLNAVVINRYNGCKCDLDEATEFRSSRTKKIQAVVAEEDWNGAVSTHKSSGDKTKKGVGYVCQGAGGGEGGDGNHMGEPLRLTFRNAPQTDAGRKLAHRFEQEYGLNQASSMIPKFNRTASGKLKRMDHYKKNESRKQERLHFERKLQSNLDQYVTRAVTELVYRVPEDVDAARPETRQTSPGHGDSLHLPMLSEAMFKERFPIPIEANEMNPKLLVCYACERTVLPSGARMFKHFATSVESQQLFVYAFWFVHCKFFQEDSQKEQAHLLRSVASRYVGVLGTDGMEEYKDFFFKHYPFVVANAILWGFHYLCPGSRHLYSNAFKRVLYLQCVRILSGIEAIPSSTNEMRTKLYPDEAAEALDELEYHPYHAHTSGARVSGVPGAPANTIAASAAAVPAALPPNLTEAVIGGGVKALIPPSGVTGGHGGGMRGSNDVGMPEPGKGKGGGGGNEEGRKKKGGGGPGEGPGGRRGDTMMQRMNKTFRPDPLSVYTGDRCTLSFKPRRQEGLTVQRPRQQRTVFDASQISPMLQEYLGQSSSTAGRRSENIIRTVPVPWCQSGGTDTYRRHPSRKELHDSINLEHTKAKREFARGKAQAAEIMRRTLRHIDSDRHAIFKKGPRHVGLKSMDIVTELQQQGALKGFKRPENQWN